MAKYVSDIEYARNVQQRLEDEWMAFLQRCHKRELAKRDEMRRETQKDLEYAIRRREQNERDGIPAMALAAMSYNVKRK